MANIRKAKTLDGKAVATMSAGEMAWWAVRYGEKWTLIQARQIVCGDETYGPFDTDGEAMTAAREKMTTKK